MSVYLHDIPLPEAQKRLQQALEEAGLWRPLGAETVPLDEDAIGRVVAEPIWAKVSSPNYHSSAMDGFAVRAADTEGAGPASPVVLHIGLPFTSTRATRFPIGQTRSSPSKTSNRSTPTAA